MRLEGGDLTGTPTRAGTYDIAFTVTMPDGATYSSVRRIVVESVGGGSSDLPDFVWPIIIIGGIGVIGCLFGPGLGSLAGSVGGSSGGSIGGSVGGSVGGSIGGSVDGWFGSLTAPGGLLAGLFGSAGSAGSDQDPGSDPSGPGGGNTGGTTGADGAEPAGPSAPADAGPTGTQPDGTGQVAADSVTHQHGEPSSEWARSNSEVRSSLPTTGVAVVDLVLWALTAAAAGVTLLLLVNRRRRGSDEN